jgi:hypothetical protein
MQQEVHKCIKRVAGKLKCLLSKGFCIEWGKSSAGKHRYKCKSCVVKALSRNAQKHKCQQGNKTNSGAYAIITSHLS